MIILVLCPQPFGKVKLMLGFLSRKENQLFVVTLIHTLAGVSLTVTLSGIFVIF